MASEDFQKGNQKRGTGLGLRDAIEDTLSNNDSLTRKKAEELFNEMSIIQEVKKAINSGENVCNITMKKGYGDVDPRRLFQGNKTYADLFEALRSLIVSEGVSCRYLTSDYDVISANGQYKHRPHNYLQIFDYLPK